MKLVVRKPKQDTLAFSVTSGELPLTVDLVNGMDIKPCPIEADEIVQTGYIEGLEGGERIAIYVKNNNQICAFCLLAFGIGLSSKVYLKPITVTGFEFSLEEGIVFDV